MIFPRSQTIVVIGFLAMFILLVSFAPKSPMPSPVPFNNQKVYATELFAEPDVATNEDDADEGEVVDGTNGEVHVYPQESPLIVIEENYENTEHQQPATPPSANTGADHNDDGTNADAYAMTDDDTIFVSVASYRDSLCSNTIESIYTNASRPDLIYIGLCQQNDPKKDVDCAKDEKLHPEWQSNIRTIRVAHQDAMGPTWARYLCSTLLDGEKYYLQIDSHCYFSPQWDAKLVKMIKMLKASGVRKPLLSHYTKAHETYFDKNDDRETVPTICKSFFNDQKMISFEGADFVKSKPNEMPRPNPYVAAGMMFGESLFAVEVPFDPNLPYLFVGEEILHSVRLWTHGWDVFTPNENVIYHFYTRENEPKFWNDVSYNNDADSVNKVRNLLELEESKAMSPLMAKNLDVYGLGKERTLQQYFDFAGIDKDRKTINFDFCKDPDVFERWEQYRKIPGAAATDPAKSDKQ